MRLIKNVLFLLFLSLTFTSCIIQAPKYTPVENVLHLQLGQTQQEVSDILKIPPYDLKSIDSTGYVLIYKYRVTDRNIIPLFMKPTNGVKARGKWVDLFNTYSKEGKVTEINSCSECGGTVIKQTKVDLKAVLTFITLTLPTIIVLFKL